MMSFSMNAGTAIIMSRPPQRPLTVRFAALLSVYTSMTKSLAVNTGRSMHDFDNFGLQTLRDYGLKISLHVSHRSGPTFVSHIRRN